MADAGTGSDVTSKMAASIGWKPEVVASAAGEQVTRSGLRRAYLLPRPPASGLGGARCPPRIYCVVIYWPATGK
jgi:hypothetical protein